MYFFPFCRRFKFLKKVDVRNDLLIQVTVTNRHRVEDWFTEPNLGQPSLV